MFPGMNLKTGWSIQAWLLVAGLSGVLGEDLDAAEFAVEFTTMQMQSGYQVKRLYGGEIQAVRISDLGFRHAGALHVVHVDEGDRVAKGTLLAELDPGPLNMLLEQAQAGVLRAEADLQVMEAELELAWATERRYKDLVDEGHASVQRYDEVRLGLAVKQANLLVARANLQRAHADLGVAEVDLQDSRLKSPYDGRIQGRYVDEGTIVVPGQRALRLVENDALRARVGIPVTVAAGLVPGEAYDFQHEGRQTTGVLIERLPEVDQQTQNVVAIFSLQDNRLPVGSSIDLILVRHVPEPGFWVPLASLTEAQRGLWSVYVLVDVDGETLTERRLVEVLHTGLQRVFVRGTLAAGDRVVTGGTRNVVPMQVVTGIPAR